MKARKPATGEGSEGSSVYPSIRARARVKDIYGSAFTSFTASAAGGNVQTIKKGAGPLLWRACWGRNHWGPHAQKIFRGAPSEISLST